MVVLILPNGTVYESLPARLNKWDVKYLQARQSDEDKKTLSEQGGLDKLGEQASMPMREWVGRTNGTRPVTRLAGMEEHFVHLDKAGGQRMKPTPYS